MLTDIELFNDINDVNTLFNTGLPVQELPAPAQSLFKEACHSLKKHNLVEASEKFAHVMRHKPDHIPTLEAIGAISSNLGNNETAADFFKAVIDLAPFYANGYIRLGSIYALLGHGKEAIPLFKRAQDLEPQNIQSGLLLGTTYAGMGQRDEAKTQYETVIRMSPDDPQAYYLYATGYHKFKNLETDTIYQKLTALEKNIKRFPLRFKQEIYATLAKAHDDVKDYDTAFAYYKKASDIKNDALKKQFNLERQIQGTQYIKTFFSKECIDKYKTLGFESDIPVFIAGMPRSGTTLLEQILHAHPDIHGIGEVRYIDDILQSHKYIEDFNKHLFTQKLRPDSPSLTPEEFGKLYIDKITRTPEEKKARRIINKAISNFSWLGVIATALPRAKIIHINRNPLDSCLSTYTRQFRSDEQPYSYDLVNLGLFYQSYADLMEHWHSVIPDMILNVQYEDIVNDFENQARRIIDFLGLPWNDQCLRFFESQKFVSTASVHQVRQPIYKTAQNKWKNYDRHLAPLIKALGPYAPEDSLYVLEQSNP